jgi:HTH-type transcriptional regulator/antitoxin HigA
MTPTLDKNAYASLLAEFQPQVITTEEENERALSVVEKLMAMRNRTPEQNALLNRLVD